MTWVEVIGLMLLVGGYYLVRRRRHIEIPTKDLLFNGRKWSEPISLSSTRSTHSKKKTKLLRSLL